MNSSLKSFLNYFKLHSDRFFFNLFFIFSTVTDFIYHVQGLGFFSFFKINSIFSKHVNNSKSLSIFLFGETVSFYSINWTPHYWKLNICVKGCPDVFNRYSVFELYCLQTDQYSLLAMSSLRSIMKDLVMSAVSSYIAWFVAIFFRPILLQYCSIIIYIYI